MLELAGYSSVRFLDDGNRYDALGLRAERGLLCRAALNTRLFLDVEYGQNSLTNVVYFSPDYAATWQAVHMIDHAVYRRYDHAFVHRLFTGAGQYHQAAFEAAFIWHVQYEHDYALSDMTGLQWGARYGHRVYDGKGTYVFSAYLGFQQVF